VGIGKREKAPFSVRGRPQQKEKKGVGRGGVERREREQVAQFGDDLGVLWGNKGERMGKTRRSIA